jgi:hypothetical protein
VPDPEADPAGPVQRQSVRRTFDDQPAGQGLRGTPPPATPAARRPEPPAATSSRTGATAVVGSTGAAGTFGATTSAYAPSSALPPSVPPTVRPAAARRPADDFDQFISRPTERAPRLTVNATPIVLTIIGILVVVGMVWAWKALTAPAPPIGGEQGLSLTDDGPVAGADDPAGDGTAEDPVVEQPGDAAVDPAGVPPVIASAQMIDPPPGGDNNEHPEVAPLAIDGDPTTAWYSRTYASPTYGMKSGVGYAVTFAEPSTVTTVTLLVNGTGGSVEVRATDPSTPTEGTVLASGSLSAQTVLTLSAPTATQHIVLWFPALPQNPEGANRIELLEVQVS